MKTRSIKLMSTSLVGVLCAALSTSVLAYGPRGPDPKQHQVEYYRSAPSGSDVFGAVLGGVVIGAMVNEAIRPKTTYVAPAAVYNYETPMVGPIGYANEAPHYYAPAPVWVQPAQVYARPAPVYVQPQVSMVCDWRGFCYEQRAGRHHHYHGYRY